MSDKTHLMRFAPCGDTGFLVEFAEEISPAVNEKVRRLALLLKEIKPPWLRELVPAYRSVLLYYDPELISFHVLEEFLLNLEDNSRHRPLPLARVTVFPVVYGGEYGPDLEGLAAFNHLSPREVVDLHTGVDYRVYMLGFTPGFPYLGGMSPRISMPRLATPRLQIPPGSVGIAGLQTGIYPLESPGGWRLIGRTPVRLWDPRKDPPVLLSVGDSVRFASVNEAEYLLLLAEVEKGRYQLQVEKKDA